MVRKRDRVIGTLIVWLAIVLAMAAMLGRLGSPGLDMQNFWSYSGNVVTGGTSEEAMAALQDFNSITNELQLQTRQIAEAELLAYLPYILLLSVILLAGGLLSTLFIWRSVVVPGELMERVREYKEDVPQSRSIDLDDDGELMNTGAGSTPPQHYREEIR